MAIEHPLAQPSATPALAYSRPPSIEEAVSPGEQDVRNERTTTPPSQDEAADRSKSSEKKMHPCWMCHKSFDRPSTLRKHLLVHTGHKAFACDTCGRRFGVQSNLNRHAKKCAQRPVNQGASAQAAVPGSSAAEGTTYAEVAAPVELATEAAGPSSASTSAIALQVISAPSEQTRGRKRKAAPPMEGGPDDQAGEVSRKERRPRRKKSPMRWVPDSLKLYDLTLTNKATPVPLPSVRPFVDSNGKVLEERDSYNPDVHDTPYHPRGWMGRLPGPGLMDAGGSVASSGRLLIF
ncbi:uncharacterized protein B0H18DRAFT_1213431 [Fomitopsis serialis]|uniref:uncharacterized protein n=1 Tax=Fomitopsis serialis TaxID=139415 RepID=UPI0020081DBC|nr:uncharacterized protein B0H18DRAFT_1213431 [Neoantrodia serialis]KAH9920303.1 hypothetical protein B0H18DRAFT_1213431 [Neoantrodia serialis]